MQRECSFCVGRVLLKGEFQLPKVTEAHRESRRAQILDAAMACFARQGFHQTTMQDICREAAFSPGGGVRALRRKRRDHPGMLRPVPAERSIEPGSDRSHGQTCGGLGTLVELTFAGMDGPKSVEMLRMNVQSWSEAMRGAPN